MWEDIHRTGSAPHQLSFPVHCMPNFRMTDCYGQRWAFERHDFELRMTVERHLSWGCQGRGCSIWGAPQKGGGSELLHPRGWGTSASLHCDVGIPGSPPACMHARSEMFKSPFLVAEGAPKTKDAALCLLTSRAISAGHCKEVRAS